LIASSLFEPIRDAAAGRAPGQFDVLNVTGNASLDGTLRLINQGYQPQNGDELKLVTTGGAVSGRFAQFQNPFALAVGFNTIDLVYARQSVTLEFLTLITPITPPIMPVPPRTPVIVATTDFSSFAFTPNQAAAGNLLDAVQLDPKAANLISFLNTEPFSNLPSDLQKISPDGLTAFYEISFSNANIQKLNLESRLDDLHSGSNGFSSNMKVNGATVNLEDRADADVVEPSLKAAWEHEYKYSGLPITAGFAGIPGPSATFFGPSEGHDSALVSAGISVRLTPAITTYVHYDGQLGRGNYDSNAVTGGVRISF
jgi:uncharacterized protein with beta-barrel porin domain